MSIPFLRRNLVHSNHSIVSRLKKQILAHLNEKNSVVRVEARQTGGWEFRVGTSVNCALAADLLRATCSNTAPVHLDAHVLCIPRMQERGMSYPAKKVHCGRRTHGGQNDYRPAFFVSTSNFGKHIQDPAKDPRILGKWPQ